MLSMRFGYGRPAFAAARCALRFCAGDKPFGLPRPLGRFLSHTAFGFFSAIGLAFLLSHFGFHRCASYTATCLLGILFCRAHASLCVRKCARLTVLRNYFWHYSAPNVDCPPSPPPKRPPDSNALRPARRALLFAAAPRSSRVDSAAADACSFFDAYCAATVPTFPSETAFLISLIIGN